MAPNNDSYRDAKCFFMHEAQKKYGLKLIKDLVKDNNLSRIFGFILYTDADAFVANALTNEGYWKSLDYISGDRWPIFAVRPLRKGNDVIYGGAPNGTGFLVTKWNEPIENLDVLTAFDIDNTKDLPCFVAFMWDDNDKIQSISIKIEGRTEPEVYERIKEIVTAIANAEKAVEPQYKRNVELFRNVEAELKGLKFRYKWKVVNKALKFIKELIELFK